jgi:hypothetical protein
MVASSRRLKAINVIYVLSDLFILRGPTQRRVDIDRDVERGGAFVDRPEPVVVEDAVRDVVNHPTLKPSLITVRSGSSAAAGGSPGQRCERSEAIGIRHRITAGVHDAREIFTSFIGENAVTLHLPYSDIPIETSTCSTPIDRSPLFL